MDRSRKIRLDPECNTGHWRGVYRSVRGGQIAGSSFACRSAFRMDDYVTGRYSNSGLRLTLTDDTNKEDSK